MLEERPTLSQQVQSVDIPKAGLRVWFSKAEAINSPCKTCKPCLAVCSSYHKNIASHLSFDEKSMSFDANEFMSWGFRLRLQYDLPVELECLQWQSPGEAVHKSIDQNATLQHVIFGLNKTQQSASQNVSISKRFFMFFLSGEKKSSQQHPVLVPFLGSFRSGVTFDKSKRLNWAIGLCQRHGRRWSIEPPATTQESGCWQPEL